MGKWYQSMWERGVCFHYIVSAMPHFIVYSSIMMISMLIVVSSASHVPAAGLSSLGTSRLVVVGGIAELIAGTISMDIGGFLAFSAEQDHCHYMRRHILVLAWGQQSCIEQMEREVCAVLVPAITKCLRDAEFDLKVSANSSSSDEGVQLLRWKDQAGLTWFLLKFGEEWEISIRQVYSSVLIIGFGYLVGGIIPLIPYFFVQQAHVALVYSCIVTGIVLLIFGAVKARVMGAGHGVGGYGTIWGAVSTLLVGDTAAAAGHPMLFCLKTSDSQIGVQAYKARMSGASGGVPFQS
ncbi:VIT family-domain-containing protein [Suillus discolor]|uniref:VIT family-domain-containing protein n=1 Tax=Suillus discolor TaxID=1912936 RepID=A0A9P7JWG2_9AGAM|nr:VIT family-domain-containing protein [Suillus discolor]KAG2112354.1 VIT family-domain-containing protein [Suillus discolor]